MELLSLKNISKHFGGINVLNNVSLEIQSGSVVAIVGDNGAGKSTLLKSIAGLYKPDSGEVYYKSQSITNCSALQRRALGIEMVYQDLALAKQQDIVNNLFIGREIKKALFFLDRNQMLIKAKEKLAELDIRIPDLNKKVGELSGGQQQSVAIARALLFNPEILLLDEPTAALAQREVGKVIELIQLQKSQGRTIILVSHRLNDVFAVADRIVVLKQGSVFSDDSKDDLSLSEVVERIVA